MGYDTEYLGTENRLHPANAVEVEMTEAESLQAELAEMRSTVKFCRELVKQMEAIENKDNFFVAGLDAVTERAYISKRSQLYYKIKYGL